MKAVTGIQSEMRRLCSDFAAGFSGLDNLELGAAELLRQRAGCHAVALWTLSRLRVGNELRCAGRLHNGVVDPHTGRPAPVTAASLVDYLRWMRSSRFLMQDTPGAGRNVIAQAWQLHCKSAVAFLHVPTFYNGELRGVVCFSDHQQPIEWSGSVRRDIQELISKVMLYVCPERQEGHEQAAV